MLLNCGVGKTLESSLDCKEIQPVHPKGDQSWVFIGKTDVEDEILILWPPDGKSWLIWKVPDSGKDWGQDKKGMTEDAMVGWHHQLNGHEFEKTLGFGDGQGGLACCGPWGNKESDMTKLLNWTEIESWLGGFLPLENGIRHRLYFGINSDLKDWENSTKAPLYINILHHFL